MPEFENVLDPHTIDPTEIDLEGGDTQIEIEPSTNTTDISEFPVGVESIGPIKQEETDDIVNSVETFLASNKQDESDGDNPKSSEMDNSANTEEQTSINEGVSSLNPELQERINRKEILEPSEALLFHAWNKIYHHNSKSILPGSDIEPIDQILLSDFGVFHETNNPEDHAKQGVLVNFTRVNAREIAVLQRAYRKDSSIHNQANTENGQDEYHLEERDALLIDYEVITTKDGKLHLKVNDVLYWEPEGGRSI